VANLQSSANVALGSASVAVSSTNARLMVLQVNAPFKEMRI